MFKKMLLAMSCCMVAYEVFPMKAEVPLFEKKATEVFERTFGDKDINVVAIDSEEMCVLEQEVAYGWIDNIEDIANFREKLAELSLKKLKFANVDSVMKAALICFALQSTSKLSEKLWEKYDIENLLFKKGRFDAEDKCMDMYQITKGRKFVQIPTQIWMFMYSKHLVNERFPE